MMVPRRWLPMIGIIQQTEYGTIRATGRVRWDMTAAASPGTRILLVRPDHLGDVLLTLPAATALRRLLPAAHIRFLVPEPVGAVPRHCPDIDATYTLPFPPLTRPFDPGGWAGIVAQAAGDLRGRFDLAILPRPDDPWSGALVAAAGIPIRLGYDSPRTRPHLTAALPEPGGCHVVVLALNLAAAAAAALGVPAAMATEVREPPRFVPTAAEETEARTVLAQTALESDGRPVVLHPGSGWPLKNWPAQRWGELAAALRQRYGVLPLVTGSQAERDLVAAVVDAGAGWAAGLAGRLSLGGLAALYRRARLVIATDSGPLHLATAVGTPVVGLYGPAGAQQFGPWCPPRRSRTVRVQLPCSPCGTLSDPPCGARIEPACVTGISVAAVLAAAADFLDA